MIHPTLASLRATQLYRTLLHEIGHHLDYRATGPEAWGSKPAVDKESFAHQYATSIYAKPKEKAVMPFARILNEASLLEDGLHLEDFISGDWTGAVL